MGRTERVATAFLVGAMLIEGSEASVRPGQPEERNQVTAGQLELEFATHTPSQSVDLHSHEELTNISNIIVSRTSTRTQPIFTEEPTLEDLRYFIQQTPTPNIFSAIIEDGSFRGILKLSPSFVPENMTILNETPSIVLWGGQSEYLIQESALPFIRKFSDDIYQTTGDRLMIVSGYRSYSHQVALNSEYPDQAAIPGSSQHQTGYAMTCYL